MTPMTPIGATTNPRRTSDMPETPDLIFALVCGCLIAAVLI